MSDERGMQWSGEKLARAVTPVRLLERWMQSTGEPYDIQRELVRDTKAWVKKQKRPDKSANAMTREELVRSVTMWAETAMELQEELESYKGALDVKLAGDGLIEFKGRYYKRLEEAIDEQS